MIKIFRLRSKQGGFTLIELLVVIAIIGILSTCAVVALNNAREKSRDAKRVSDVKQMQTALELLYNDANGYATAITAGSAIFHGGTTYMASAPTNPSPGGTPYTYATIGSEPYTSYTLTYTLEGTTGGITSGLHTATPSGIQ